MDSSLSSWMRLSTATSFRRSCYRREIRRVHPSCQGWKKGWSVELGGQLHLVPHLYELSNFLVREGADNASAQAPAREIKVGKQGSSKFLQCCHRSDVNGFGEVNGGTLIQFSEEGMGTTLVYFHDMVLPTVFDVLSYVTRIMNIDRIVRNRKLNIYRTYAVWTRIGIAVSLASKRRNQWLRK